MALNERRAHWKIGAAEGERNEAMVREVDPDARRYACFTMSEHAAEWLIEQLAMRTVADLGGFNRAADWHDWVLRQGTQDEEADAEQRHTGEGGAHRVTSAEIGDVEYRMEVCTCTGEVTGRCRNPGCDRDTDYDTEPGYGEGSYTRWGETCYRCFGGRWADGGYSSEGTPVPLHRHKDGNERAYLHKLIEADEWIGWRCRSDDADASGCGALWLFEDADDWASRFRLTRAWDGKVTGTEGYTRTEEEAVAEVERRNADVIERGSGYTVGYEKIKKEY